MSYAQNVEPYAAALRMIREAVEELFGPLANMESEEAVLLRGPEPVHEAEAIVEALHRVRAVASPIRVYAPRRTVSMPSEPPGRGLSNSSSGLVR